MKCALKKLVFGKAAMPFLCNGILLNQFNLHRVILVLYLKSVKVHCYFASFPIPLFNLLFFSYNELPSFVIDHFLMCSIFVSQIVLCCLQLCVTLFILKLYFLQDNMDNIAKKHYIPNVLPFPTMILLLV